LDRAALIADLIAELLPARFVGAHPLIDEVRALIAGGCLALPSLFGMVMLHEFLAQCEQGTAYVKPGDRPAAGTGCAAHGHCRSIPCK